MKVLWWVVGIVAFLAMLYSCALPGDLAVGRDSDDGLAGTYTVNGVDPTGVEYSGIVIIKDDVEPDAFIMEWIITGAVQEGSARLTGDELTVVWQTVASAGGTGTGTGTYRVEADGSLVGTKFIDGFTDPAAEVILPEA